MKSNPAEPFSKPETGNWKLVALALCLCVSVVGVAQNFVTVSATNVQNAFGQKLSAGQVCFQAVNSTGQPIGFLAGGGGQVINRAVCGPVTNGAFSVSVPNTALTAPANVCFHVTVKDSSTNQLVLGSAPSGQPSGYDCLQPAASNGWCSSGSCNFDNYTPNLAPLATVQTGPTGSAGPANSLAIGTVTTLSPGSSATASISGAPPNQTLSLGIPQGATGATGSLPGNLTISGNNVGFPGAITATAPLALTPSAYNLVLFGHSRIATDYLPGSMTLLSQLTLQPQFAQMTIYNYGVDSAVCESSGISGSHPVLSYSSGAHTKSPAVTGKPGYIINQLYINDVLSQSTASASAIETCISGILSAEAADGFKIINSIDWYSTAETDSQEAIRVAVNGWLKELSQANPSYLLIDLDGPFPPVASSSANIFRMTTSHFTADGTHLNEYGIAAEAAFINNKFGQAGGGTSDYIDTARELWYPPSGTERIYGQLAVGTGANGNAQLGDITCSESGGTNCNIFFGTGTGTSLAYIGRSGSTLNIQSPGGINLSLAEQNGPASAQVLGGGLTVASTTTYLNQFTDGSIASIIGVASGRLYLGTTGYSGSARATIDFGIESTNVLAALSPGDIYFRLGDSAGSKKIYFQNSNQQAPARLDSQGNLIVNTVQVSTSTLISSNVALGDGTGSSAATLTNAPAATNPSKWIPISDNGTTRYIPAW